MAASVPYWLSQYTNEGEFVVDPFDSIERVGGVGASCEAHLKSLIAARRLLAGDRLPPERELAARLDVSRGTLRGALQSLAEQGVLVGRQGSGWVVRPRPDVVATNLAVYLSLEEVTFDQLFAARRAIEPHAAAAAAIHRTTEHLAAMRRCTKAMRSAPDVATYVRADADFHALVTAASGNPLFSVMLAPTLDLLGPMREDVAAHAEVTAASHREHDRILAALAASDSDAARAAMLAHIDHFVTSGHRALAEEERGTLPRSRTWADPAYGRICNT
jgi:GntR family transcriptional repressor for pyruvate dehydrogenase complex